MATITKLTSLTGVGDVLADRIRRHLGNGNEEAALRLLEQGPYVLLNVPRVGFKTADRIALSHYRVQVDDPERHQWGNRHILSDRGSLEIQKFNAAREQLELRGVGHRFNGVEFEQGRVWLPEVLQAEQACAAWALRLPLGEVVTDPDYLPFEEAALRGLDDTQALAARAAVHGRHRVMGITGGAGTGKTHVISAIAKLGQANGHLVGVLAPTGKAADRVREALGNSAAYADAMTIHRALNYNGRGFSAGVLPWDIVVLEEASMISVDLFWHVVERMHEGARLIIVGDPGQLPPVGHGQPFADLLELGLPHVHLERNYRQAGVQGIIRMAEGIRAHRQPEGIDDGSVELVLKRGEDMDAAATAAIEAKAGQPLDDWQIITWKNEDCHMHNMNAQEILNPWGLPLFTYRPHGWTQDLEVRAGDKVVVRTNDPEYGVFNGQLGVATDVREKELVTRREAVTLDEYADADDAGYVTERKMALVVELRIGGERIDMAVADAKELLHLGYAITVHKAQGSDWEHVVLLQPRDVAFDASRWWYTSVTRARSRLSVYFTCKSEAKFWMNTRRSLQAEESTLARRIRQGLKRA